MICEAVVYVSPSRLVPLYRPEGGIIRGVRPIIGSINKQVLGSLRPLSGISIISLGVFMMDISVRIFVQVSREIKERSDVTRLIAQYFSGLGGDGIFFHKGIKARAQVSHGQGSFWSRKRVRSFRHQ